MASLRGETKAAPFRLFRYVDFDVQPGRSYQYRAQLVLRNPNFGKEPRILLNPESGKQPYRETPWSEKSTVASIPVEIQLLAGAVAKPKNGEVKGKVYVLQWFGDEKNKGSEKPYGIELLKDFELDLGGIANGGRELKDVADATTHMLRDFKDKDAVFSAGAALLDVHGGLNAKGGSDNSVEPAELLLLRLDDKGQPTQLVVTNQARDSQAVEAWNKTHVVPAGLEQANGIGGSQGPSPLVPGPSNPLLNGSRGPKAGPPRIGKGGEVTTA